MVEIHSVNSPVIVPAAVVRQTLTELQSAGRQRSERIVLWLGRRTRDAIKVELFWVPDQQAGHDFFEIPEDAMRDLFCELRTRRLMVAAQVHTHPRQAFHSYADDTGAIVRHTGALSLVVPHFGLQTELNTFIQHTAAFVLSRNNEWLEADPANVERLYHISA